MAIRGGAAFVGALVMWAAAVVPGQAEAACTTTLTAPADGSTQIQSPTFRWSSTDCSQFRLWFSPSGTFGADKVLQGWQTTKQKKLSEDSWDTYQAGAWAGGVYWKVQGKAADGSLSFSSVRRVLMDPNIDDDAYSVSQGDCDDNSNAVYPGAAETCGDGIDQDCDGADTPCAVEYHVPSYATWGFATFPVWSPENTVLYYAGSWWVDYFDDAFNNICTDYLFFNATYDNTIGAYGCPGCRGEMNTFIFAADPDYSTCVFEDPSLWLGETFWNDAGTDALLHYQVGNIPDAATEIAPGAGTTVGEFITAIQDAGLVVSHGTYMPDWADIDGDSNTTESYIYGLFYGAPNTIRPNFRTYETVYEDGTPTMFIYFYQWWLYGV